MVNKSGELWAKFWIHFEDAAVDMGGGAVLHGDMTMLVTFHAGTADAVWDVQNGTGQLRHLGGQGTLVWADTGMDCTGTVWTQKQGRWTVAQSEERGPQGPRSCEEAVTGS